MWDIAVQLEKMHLTLFALGVPDPVLPANFKYAKVKEVLKISHTFNEKHNKMKMDTMTKAITSKFLKFEEHMLK